MKRFSLVAMFLLVSCHSERPLPKVVSGQPAEVSEFYKAVGRADAAAIQRLYPAWRKSGLLDVDGRVPLTIAAKNGHLDVVKLLTELGESPNRADPDGFTPLMMALHWNHADIADFLLDAGATPTNESRLWQSSLMIAVHEGRRPIIMRLLRNGATVDSVETWSGNTALHEAVMYRNYEAIETLIAAGANPEALNKDGKTPEQLAYEDACVIHLFRGGLIKEEPTICQLVKRESATFELRSLIH